MNPIKSSLRYPAVALTLTLGLLLLGTQAILHMPRMEDPSVTIHTGIVAAVYPGATSDQVESQLAKRSKIVYSSLPKFGRRKRIRPAGRDISL